MTDHRADAPPCGACCDDKRRAALKLCAGAVIGLVAAPKDAAHADEAEDARPQPGDRLAVFGDEGETLHPLDVADIKAGAKPLVVYPLDPATGTLRDGSRLNRILLLRLDPASLDDHTRALAADGVVAYSAVCTHQGCDLSEYNPKEGVLFCFCHFSKFRPTRGGEVVSGPAPRSLPILPLRSDSGELVVADSFSARPGATV
ncbi:Rieske (2Fe-2S) protein [Nitrogeniibacter mangrovi]|uniref:Rieske (2Fe-2S) protein n=1 Tax=Nitrogeniibacter mangrovi TaxID=2016596 RepID=A0A6C1B704_9RHOO|nr:Rieske (2Fe-2S) protein [Nitrogeniibacter mangrovi]QID19257.1 Rieske (2Fe-2S) protein [Nitrogeniibacter mangrovi]